MCCFDSRGFYVSPEGALAQQHLTKTLPTDQYITHLAGWNYNHNLIRMTPHMTRFIWRQTCGRSLCAIIVLGMKKKGCRNVGGASWPEEKKSSASTHLRRKVCGMRGTTSELNRNLLAFCPERLKVQRLEMWRPPSGYVYLTTILKAFDTEQVNG